MTGVLAGMIGGMKGPTKPVTAPTSLSAIPTNTNVAISFTAPSDNGGSPITNYEYSFNNSTWTALSPADAVSPITVSGLTENTAYTIYLRAVNIFGSGPASSVLSFTTAGVPTGAVTINSVTYTTIAATINFTVAAGGGAITGYDLYVVNQTNAWNNATASPISVTGLTPNTAYAFYVRAKNAYGTGPQSEPYSITTLKTSTGSVEYLVIAGGGGSGTNGGGGGGAGGVVQGTASVSNAGSYTIWVGAGGGGGSPSGAGGASTFGAGKGQAVGGGGGGSRDSDFAGKNGGSGGGGGGSGGQSCPGGIGTISNGPPPFLQGRDGAAGRTGGGEAAGGGGGGFGSVGTTSPAIYYGGNGGNGLASSITGTSVGYAGGGCGMGLGYLGGQPGTVQAGYGGGGPQNSSSNGRANSGGGGGDVAGGAGGGSGGSGVVIIAYPTSYRELQTITGGLSATLSTVSRPGYYVYTFTGGTGTISF